MGGPVGIIGFELVQKVGLGITIGGTVLCGVQEGMTTAMDHVISGVGGLSVLLVEETDEFCAEIVVADALVDGDGGIVTPAHACESCARIRLSKTDNVRVEVGIVAVGATRLVGDLHVLRRMDEDGFGSFARICQKIDADTREGVLRILVLQDGSKRSGAASTDPDALQVREELSQFDHVQLSVDVALVECGFAGSIVRHNVVTTMQITRAVRDPGVVALLPGIVLVITCKGEPPLQRVGLILRPERSIVEPIRHVVCSLLNVAGVVIVARSTLLVTDDEFLRALVEVEGEAGLRTIGAGGAGDINPDPLVINGRRGRRRGGGRIVAVASGRGGSRGGGDRSGTTNACGRRRGSRRHFPSFATKSITRLDGTRTIKQTCVILRLALRIRGPIHGTNHGAFGEVLELDHMSHSTTHSLFTERGTLVHMILRGPCRILGYSGSRNIRRRAIRGNRKTLSIDGPIIVVAGGSFKVGNVTGLDRIASFQGTPDKGGAWCDGNATVRSCGGKEGPSVGGSAERSEGMTVLCVIGISDAVRHTVSGSGHCETRRFDPRLWFPGVVNEVTDEGDGGGHSCCEQKGPCDG